MKKEMFDKIQEAEIFDLYGAKVEYSDTNPGVFMKKANGELVKITMANISEAFDLDISNISEAFDLNIPIQNQN